MDCSIFHGQMSTFTISRMHYLKMKSSLCTCTLLQLVHKSILCSEVEHQLLPILPHEGVENCLYRAVRWCAVSCCTGPICFILWWEERKNSERDNANSDGDKTAWVMSNSFKQWNVSVVCLETENQTWFTRKIVLHMHLFLGPNWAEERIKKKWKKKDITSNLWCHHIFDCPLQGFSTAGADENGNN